MTGHPYPLDYVNRIVSCNITEGRYRLITVKHEIPGQSVVIPGSLDRPSKLVKSLDCPGQPWTVGNYATVVVGIFCVLILGFNFQLLQNKFFL